MSPHPSEGRELTRSEADRWLDEHGDALYAFALKRGVSETDAEEIVQETLLTALQTWSRFEGRSSVRTWLVGILRYKILEHYRAKRSRGSAVELPDETADLFGSRGKWRFGMPRSWSGNAEDLAVNDEFKDALERCLERLPERQAEAFLLVERHGISVAGLTTLLDMTANNIHVMLHRARANLRRCLEKRWFRKGRE